MVDNDVFARCRPSSIHGVSSPRRIQFSGNKSRDSTARCETRYFMDTSYPGQHQKRCVRSWRLLPKHIVGWIHGGVRSRVP